MSRTIFTLRHTDPDLSIVGYDIACQAPASITQLSENLEWFCAGSPQLIHAAKFIIFGAPRGLQLRDVDELVELTKNSALGARLCLAFPADGTSAEEVVTQLELRGIHTILEVVGPLTAMGDFSRLPVEGVIFRGPPLIDATRSSRALIVASGLIRLAKSLGLMSIASGMVDGPTRQWLLGLEIDYLSVDDRAAAA